MNRFFMPCDFMTSLNRLAGARYCLVVSLLKAYSTGRAAPNVPAFKVIGPIRILEGRIFIIPSEGLMLEQW